MELRQIRKMFRWTQTSAVQSEFLNYACIYLNDSTGGEQFLGQRLRNLMIGRANGEQIYITITFQLLLSQPNNCDQNCRWWLPGSLIHIVQVALWHVKKRQGRKTCEEVHPQRPCVLKRIPSHNWHMKLLFLETCMKWCLSK